MKASMTEELSSVQRFIVGGERYSVIPFTGCLGVRVKCIFSVSRSGMCEKDKGNELVGFGFDIYVVCIWVSF